MKKGGLLGRAIMLGAAALLADGLGANVQADPVVSMSLGDTGTYADNVNLGAMLVPGNPTETGSIGIYSFTVQNNGGTSIPSTFWTTCLSPAGEVFSGASGNYNNLTFQEAAPGLNPTGWAQSSDGSQLWGIQNANYLWTKVQHGNAQPALSADAAAGLVLAMYDALYNSTGYGNVGPLTKFNPNFSANPVTSGNQAAVEAAYNADLLLLSTAGISIAGDLATGNILMPQDPDAGGPTGQSFIFVAPPVANVVAVPEPATMGVVAALGALFLSVGARFRRVQV